MTIRATLGLLAALLLAGCGEEPASVAPPAPVALDAEAIGRYCGMNVLEHPGPKGQVILDPRLDPIWFSSARDVIAFTLLPEEPKNFQALYVSDMGRAESWDKPDPTGWVEARKAFFVIESDRKSGMGADETVPFAERAAAEKFAAEHGGRVVTFAEVPRDYVLGGDNPPGGQSPPGGETAPQR